MVFETFFKYFINNFGRAGIHLRRTKGGYEMAKYLEELSSVFTGVWRFNIYEIKCDKVRRFSGKKNSHTAWGNEAKWILISFHVEKTGGVRRLKT